MAAEVAAAMRSALVAIASRETPAKSTNAVLTDAMVVVGSVLSTPTPTARHWASATVKLIVQMCFVGQTDAGEAAAHVIVAPCARQTAHVS